MLYPHSSAPPLMVAAKVSRRLHVGDRVEFVVSERTGLVENLRVYRPAAYKRIEDDA